MYNQTPKDLNIPKTEKGWVRYLRSDGSPVAPASVEPVKRHILSTLKG
jgi:hypothetical protein